MHLLIMYMKKLTNLFNFRGPPCMHTGTSTSILKIAAIKPCQSCQKVKVVKEIMKLVNRQEIESVKANQRFLSKLSQNVKIVIKILKLLKLRILVIHLSHLKLEFLKTLILKVKFSEYKFEQTGSLFCCHLLSSWCTLCIGCGIYPNTGGRDVVVLDEMIDVLGCGIYPAGGRDVVIEGVIGGLAGLLRGGKGGGTCSCSGMMLLYESLLHCTYWCRSGRFRDLASNLGKAEHVCIWSHSKYRVIQWKIALMKPIVINIIWTQMTAVSRPYPAQMLTATSANDHARLVAKALITLGLIMRDMVHCVCGGSWLATEMNQIVKQTKLCCDNLFIYSKFLILYISATLN